MRNLRKRYTIEERADLADTVNVLRPYILKVLMQRQSGACATCSVVGVPFDIDHKAYNPMVSVNDLQLLCWPCHRLKTWPNGNKRKNNTKRGCAVAVA